VKEPNFTTDKTIEQLIAENNCKEIEKMFDEVQLYEYTSNYTTMSNHLIATLVLNYASVCERRGKLSEELAEIIIARTASSVDIFKFLRTLIVYSGIEVSEYEHIELPPELLYDLLNDKMNDSVSDRILELDEASFYSLAAMIIGGKVKELNHGFSIPVIQYIYFNDTMPLEDLLIYMAANLDQPSVAFLEELSRGVFGMFL